MEWLKELNSVLGDVLGVTLIALITGAGRLFWKMYKELSKRNDQLDELLKGQSELDERLDTIEKQGDLRQEASLASLHDRIYSGYEVILRRGYVTMKELNNMEHLWKAYSGLGGNGTGQKMYDRITQMEIRKDDE